MEPDESNCDPGHEQCADYRKTITSLTALNAELLSALRGLESLFARPDEGSLEHFERVGEEFYRDTGYLRPGKDSMLHDPAEREMAWSEWRDGKLLNARGAIARATMSTATGSARDA